MNARTVGVLAALGMLVSSVSVWSLTKKKPWQPPTPIEQSWNAGAAASQPGTGAGFVREGTLKIEGRLGHSRLAADDPGETYVFANVTAEGTSGGTSAPLNLAIVIDRSGSMKGKRLINALEAARGMIRHLRDGDVLSVIAYDTRTETIFPPSTMDASSRDRAIGSLGQIEARGDTCISCGIDAGMAALRSRSGITRMLLLSDGEATAGVKDIDGFRRIAASARAMGCPISSIGVDLDYNERVLSELALDSNGQHYFAENASDLEHAFDSELSQLVRTVAKDAEVEVTLAPGVQLEKVVDRSFRQDGQRLFVRMGTFSAGQQKTLLLSVRVPKGAPGEARIADLSLSASDPENGRHLDSSGTLSVELSSEPGRSELDSMVAARLGRTETADAIVEANELFKAGDVEGAKQRLERTRTSVAHTKTEALKNAPPGSSRALGGDFDRQAGELESAEKRFDDAPKTGAVKPSATPQGKSGTRRNAEQANPFRF